MKIHYEYVSAGGQRDENNAQILAEVIKEGGAKGWKFVTVLNDFGQNIVVFEVPTTERRSTQTRKL